jgi:hypothetical protein
MAWTAPRTWTTAEVVTAAIMNVHVRDNLLQTAPAKMTTTGDIIYASAANTPTRLPAGSTAQFLRGAAGAAPTWSNALQGQLRVDDASGIGLEAYNTGADPADFAAFQNADELVRIWYRDDSASLSKVLVDAHMDDFILHTGASGQGQGAVTVGSDTNAGGAFTTGGAVILQATAVATGGPAYVKGWWMVTVRRTSAASVSGLSVQARQDGANLDNSMAFLTPNVIDQGDVIPSVNDEYTFTGMFWRRVTSSDTSDYEIFATADDNSRFDFVYGHLYVESIQYPT